MRVGRLAAWLAVLALGAGTGACVLPPDTPTVIASANGTGPQDAYRVASLAQELEVLRVLGLRVQTHARHVRDGVAYDVVQAADGATGEEREVWFDISRFSGR